MLDLTSDLGLAIDLQPNRAILATVDADGIADVRRIERLPTMDADACLAQLLQAAKILRDRAPKPIARLGVAVTGAQGLHLAASLGQLLELPTQAQPRGVCAAWGEAMLGAGRQLPDFALLWLGENIDGGVVLAGKPWLRTLDFAHLPVDPLGPLCSCGKRGCLHRYVSAEALEASAALLQVPRSHPAAGGHDRGLHEELGRRAAAGERLVLTLLDDAARAVGVALAGLTQALDLSTVLLTTQARTGAVGLVPLLNEALATHAGREVRVVASLLAEDAPLVGAGLL